jgi:hypothetical protein
VLASIVSLGIRLSSHRSCQDIHVWAFLASLFWMRVGVVGVVAW